MWCFGFLGGWRCNFCSALGANIECPFILSRFDWMKLSIGVSACLLAKLNLYQQLELKLDQPVPFEHRSNRSW